MVSALRRLLRGACAPGATDPLIDALLEQNKARPVAGCEVFDPALQRAALERHVEQLQALLAASSPARGAGARVVPEPPSPRSSRPVREAVHSRGAALH